MLFFKPRSARQQNPSNKTSHRTVSFLLVAVVLLLVVPLSIAIGTQYKKALPGYQYRFPHDHASHPDFKTEWWYYTGHLNTRDNHHYGYELTFFRVGREPSGNTIKKLLPGSAWSTQELYAAHFALSDEGKKKFQFSEKLNRMGVGVAGARTDTYYVWNELWAAEQLGKSMVLRAELPDGKQAVHLLLSSDKPPVIHGENGVSQKSDCTGCASHYYSLTRLKTEGNILIDGKMESVSGFSWMDHEFGSNQLSKKQTGWDWFSIQLNDNTELMLYLLRTQNGTVDLNSSGTFVLKDGKSHHLPLSAFFVTSSQKTWTSPVSGGQYPMGWRITVPSEKLSLDVIPTFENQELQTSASTQVAYWEGSVNVSGQRNGLPVKGLGYVEMTGYAKGSVQGKL